MYFIGGVLAVLIGVFMLWKPDIIFLITESWKHNGEAEPSDVFCISTRIGGGIIACLGVCGIVAQFII